jgi:hypothetical protein
MLGCLVLALAGVLVTCIAVAVGCAALVAARFWGVRVALTAAAAALLFRCGVLGLLGLVSVVVLWLAALRVVVSWTYAVVTVAVVTIWLRGLGLTAAFGHRL